MLETSDLLAMGSPDPDEKFQRKEWMLDLQ